ncbi:ubiquitin carboxyl-terminal hydrolase 2-like [Bidens hawaiensis]|uniref:ubiquitin carboxyl-terminal hydrolase 2-like n=1 Tax=Bidens hawaiensis TaxID=980011 RepID=UPI004049E852
MGKEAAARVHCSHLKDGIRFENLSSKITSSSCESLQCDDCRKLVLNNNTRGGKLIKLGKRKKLIWMCLACGQCTCGGIGFPTTPHSHAPRHARLNRHPLAGASLVTHSFHCSSDSLTLTLTYDDVKVESLNASENGNGDGGGGYTVKGLLNLGNTCFFNSILQNLLAMDTLRDHYMTLDGSIQALSAALKELFLETSSQSTTDLVNPRALFDSVCAMAPQFKGFQQQDSHELLRFLLDGLCNESSGIVDTMFGGQTSSSVCCLECGHTSVVYEPYLDLSLSLPTKKSVSKSTPSKKLRHPFKRHMNFGLKFYNGYDKLSEVKLKKSDENLALVNYVEPNTTWNSSGNHKVNSFDFSTFLDCVKPTTVSSDYDKCVWDDSDNDNDVVADYAKLADDVWSYRLVPVSSSSDHNTASQNEKPSVIQTSGIGNDVVTDSNDSLLTNDHNTSQNESTSVVQNLDIGNDVCWDDEPRVVKESEVLLLPDEKISSTSNGFDWFRDVFDEPDVVYGPTLDPIKICGIGIGTMFRRNNGYDFFNSDSEEVDNSDSPVSVEKCLADFTSTEILTRDEHAWHCEQCSKTLVERKMKPKEIEILQESDTNGPKNETLSISSDSSVECSVSNGLHNGKSDCNLEENGKESCTVQDTDACLVNGLGERVVEDKNDAKSSSDKVTRDASKRILINSVPPILTIHLKRLSQDARGRLRKLNGHVDFKEIIDLEAYMDPRRKDKGRYKYRLIGVVEHMGTMMGGHYVAYVRGGEGGKLWYNASDASVREVSLEEVLRCEAYILFYQQM